MNIFFVYIDRDNKYSEKVPSQIEYLKTAYLRKYPNKNLNVSIYSYSKIHRLLKEYDMEFAYYFDMIDPDFSAGIADISRILLLYKFGGIYHDAHLHIKDEIFFDQLLSILEEKEIIFERQPKNLIAYS